MAEQMNEADCFLIEAAMQHGFNPAEDESYVVQGVDLVKFIKVVKQYTLAEHQPGNIQELLANKPKFETFAINAEDGPDIVVEGGSRFAHESDVHALRDWVHALIAALPPQPKIIEACNTPRGQWALTCVWPDGSETVELVDDHAAALLGYIPDSE